MPVVDFGSINASMPQSSQRAAREPERLEQLSLASCGSEIQWLPRRPTAAKTPQVESAGPASTCLGRVPGRQGIWVLWIAKGCLRISPPAPMSFSKTNEQTEWPAVRAAIPLSCFRGR